MTDYKILKITNPLYLGLFGPKIKEFFDKLNIKGMTYESLYTYFANNIQFGGEVAEFRVIFDDEEIPVGFAHWFVRGLPYIGTTFMDFIYVWGKPSGPADLLIDEWIKFGRKHNCIYYEGCAISSATRRIFGRYAEKNGFLVEDSGLINFKARKKIRR